MRIPDPKTPEEWDAEAKRLGVESGEVLRAQVELADSILLEIVETENFRRKAKRWFSSSAR